MQLFNRMGFLTSVVFSFVLFVLFHNLGGHYLEDWDEAWNVLMARTAIEKHNYLFMEFRNQTFWDKSPFPFLPMIAFFKAFGINEVAARLSSSVFAFGLFLQIYMIARRFYGQWVALLAVFVATTSARFMFTHGLRGADIESITLFFLVGSVTSWLLIKNVHLKVVLTLLSLGFTFLCKGPIIAIPLIILFSAFFVDNQIKRVPLKSFIVGLIITSFVVLPWYFYMYASFGFEFIQAHIIWNFFGRYTANIFALTHGDTFYIHELLRPDNFLWFGTALMAIIYFFKKYAEDKKAIDFVLVVWVLVSFLIANQSQTKFFWYIYPLYPALAIMTARALVDFVEAPDYLTQTAYYLGFIVIMTPFFQHQVFPHSTNSNLVRVGLLSGFLFALCSGLSRYAPRYRKILSTIMVCILCYIPLKTTVMRTMHEKPLPPVTAVSEGLDFTQPIYTFQLDPSAIYYLSLKGQVHEHYDLMGIAQLQGHLVVTKTELLEEVNWGPLAESARNRGLHVEYHKKTDGTFSLNVNGNAYRLTPLRSAQGFTIVRVD